MNEKALGTLTIMFEGNYSFTTKDIPKMVALTDIEWLNFVEENTGQVTSIQVSKILYHQWAPNKSYIEALKADLASEETINEYGRG